MYLLQNQLHFGFQAQFNLVRGLIATSSGFSSLTIAVAQLNRSSPYQVQRQLHIYS
jgi:hypothetical protein